VHNDSNFGNIAAGKQVEFHGKEVYTPPEKHTNQHNDGAANRHAAEFFVLFGQVIFCGHHAAQAQCVGQAHTAKDKAVRGAKYRDDNKDNHQFSANRSKQSGSSHLYVCVAKCKNLLRANQCGNTYKVSNIDRKNHDGGENHSTGKVFLAVFNLAADGCCDNPAVKSKSDGNNGGKQAGSTHRGRVGKESSRDIAPNQASYSNQHQRNQLNQESCALEQAAQLGRKNVHDPQQNHCSAAEQHLVGESTFPAEKAAGIHACHPADNNSQSGVVKERLKPAKCTGKFGGRELVCIGQQAARLIGKQCQLAERKRAKNNSDSRNTEDNYAVAHVAAGKSKHVITFKEDAGPDNDADNHGNSGK